MYRIEIHGDDSSILSVSLSDVLKYIKDGDNLIWSILWLKATGNLNEKNILDFEEEVKSSKKGLLIKWNELVELAEKFYQVIEILIIGDSQSNLIRRYQDDKTMIMSCEYTIELVDSSYWVIYCKNKASMSMLKNNLTGAFSEIYPANSTEK